MSHFTIEDFGCLVSTQKWQSQKDTSGATYKMRVDSTGQAIHFEQYHDGEKNYSEVIPVILADQIGHLQYDSSDDFFRINYGPYGQPSRNFEIFIDVYVNPSYKEEAQKIVDSFVNQPRIPPPKPTPPPSPPKPASPQLTYQTDGCLINALALAVGCLPTIGFICFIVWLIGQIFQ